MRIQFLNGGLANQVFQYIFVRYAELENPGGDVWYFDDSFFFVNQIHNGYELEKVFGLKLNLLSRYFEPDVWEEIIRLKREGISIPQNLLNMGIPIKMLAEVDNYKQFNPFDGELKLIDANIYYPEIVKLSDENIYYHGYWINKSWFSKYKQVFLKELAFPPLTDERNKVYADKIQNTLSVGIHVRRGDFVTLNWSMSADYYRKRCEQILEQYPDAVFFIFSDDLRWCRENAEAAGFNLAGKTIYIEGNTKEKSYVDLQLLSKCKGMIMSGSSFCYLAALLGEQLAFVINPMKREV